MPLLLAARRLVTRPRVWSSCRPTELSAHQLFFPWLERAFSSEPSAPLTKLPPLWAMSKEKVQSRQYDEFYRLMRADPSSQSLFHLHLSFQAPGVGIVRALLFIPLRLSEAPGLSLYAKTICLRQKAAELLPSWLEFCQGVVDWESIPRDLDPKSIKDNAKFASMRSALVLSIVQALQEQQRQQSPGQYARFYEQFVAYLRAGLSQEAGLRRELLSLCLVDCTLADRPRSTLADIVQASPEHGLYCIVAPSRAEALRHPLASRLTSENIPVVLIDKNKEPYLLSLLKDYSPKRVIELEGYKDDKEVAPLESKPRSAVEAPFLESLHQLTSWFESVLGKRVKAVRSATRQFPGPGQIINYSGRTMSVRSKSQSHAIPPVELEINPGHPVIKELVTLRAAQPALAAEVAVQVLESCLMDAGLVERQASKKQSRFIDMVIDGQEPCRFSFSKFLTWREESGASYQYQLSEAELAHDHVSPHIKQILSLELASQKEINDYHKHSAMKAFASHARDTGSVEVQVAAITVRILYMTEHLKKNRHDFNVQRKAVQLIQARRRLLKYLKSISLERYFDMMSKLNLKSNEIIQ